MFGVVLESAGCLRKKPGIISPAKSATAKQDTIYEKGPR